MKTAVIYHGYCYDGLTAAWVAWTKLKNTAQYIPGFYGAPEPTFTEPTHIFIVDFSFSKEVIEKWLNQGHKVTLLDHHQTAVDNLKEYFDSCTNKNLFYVLDMSRSGAGIAWSYFYPTKNLPLLVQYVQDRDLWQFKFGNTSRHLYSYMQLRIEFSNSLDKQFEVIDMIHENLETYKQDSSVLEKGAVLSESYYKFCRNFAENRTMIEIPGLEFPAFPVITTNKMFGSDTCSYICKELGYQASGYFFLEKPNQWNWGMRSVGDIDVAELCKRYGGGGHKNASGFILKTPAPFPKEWRIINN